MPHDDRPIGIFDSGIGGLTVLRAVRELLPDEALIYLGDTARVPYGTRTRGTVVRYAHQVARALLEQDVKMLVVACNTASAQALPDLREAYSDDEGPPALGMIQGQRAHGLQLRTGTVPIVGVIDPGATAAVETTRNGRVGVIGTLGTIENGAYERVLHRLDPDLRITAAACPLFVALAEEGWTEGPVVELVAQRYLEPIREADVDTLILGCTHYPLLREVIQAVVGPGVTLVDGAPATARQVVRVLEATGRSRAAGAAAGSTLFQATDNPSQFRQVGSRFLARPLPAVEVVDL